MIIGRSAQRYLQRRNQDAFPTRRRPTPRLAPLAHPVHTLPLGTPLPLPTLTAEQPQPPDAGKTIPWPHGEIDV